MTYIITKSSHPLFRNKSQETQKYTKGEKQEIAKPIPKTYDAIKEIASGNEQKTKVMDIKPKRIIKK